MATDKLPLGPHSSPKVSAPKEKGNMICLTGRPQEQGQGGSGSGSGGSRALVPSNAGRGSSSSFPAARPESSGSRAIQLQHSTPVRQNPSGDFAR